MERGLTSQCIAKENNKLREHTRYFFMVNIVEFYFSQYKYINLEDMLLVSGIGRQAMWFLDIENTVKHKLVFLCHSPTSQDYEQSCKSTIFPDKRKYLLTS